MTKYLTSADILSADDRKPVKVDVPKWGGHVFVNGMTARERERFERFIVDRRNSKEEMSIRAVMAACCLCDEAGTRLFTLEDSEQLADRDWVTLDAIASVVDGIDKLTADRIQELKEIFEVAHSGDSSTS